MLDYTNLDLRSVVYLWGNQLPAGSAPFLLKKNVATETAGVHRFTYMWMQKMATILKPSLVIFGQSSDSLFILNILSMHGIFHLHRCSYIYCIIYLFEGFLCVVFWVHIQTPIAKLCAEHMRWPIGCMTPLLLISACYSLHLASTQLGGSSLRNLYSPTFQYSWNLSRKFRKRLSEAKEYWQIGRALLPLWLVSILGYGGKRRKRKPGRDVVVFHLFAVSVIVLCQYWNTSASVFLDKWVWTNPFS